MMNKNKELFKILERNQILKQRKRKYKDEKQ